MTSLETLSISKDDTAYAAWPDVALVKTSGRERLVAVYAECPHHWDRSWTRIVWRTSDDRGRTWSSPRVLAEETRPSFWNCPQIKTLPDGRLAVSVDHVTGANEGEDSDGTQDVYLFFSDDAGETFGPAVATPVRGIVPDRLFVSDRAAGTWLLSAHRRHPETHKLAVWTWRSTDGGKTWSEPIPVASDPALNLCEVSIVEADTGTLVALLRENSNEGLPAYKCFSDDLGLTWRSLSRLSIPGCHRPKGGILRSGRCLVTARLRQGGAGGFGTAQITLAGLLEQSSLLATEWSGQHTRIRPIDYDRSPYSDNGYTGWVQFSDGVVFVINYLLDDHPRGQIRGYLLKEEDIVLSEAGLPPPPAKPAF